MSSKSDSEGLVSRKNMGKQPPPVIPIHNRKEDQNSSNGSKMDSMLRYGTLVILVLQTTATVLLLRYSRTRPGQPYLASTAVMLNECCKFTVCVFSLYAQRGFSIRRSWRAFREEILGRPAETLKLIVPSGLYCLQNNLLFIALTNLDAATYQVTYQLKILTTALFSVLLLKKQIKSVQWLALLVLTIGVSLVQIPNVSSPATEAESDLKNANVSSHQIPPTVEESNSEEVIGLIAVLVACFSSGFAGVFFEMLVKTGAQPSVVIRNLQLGIFSLAFATSAVIFNDWSAIAKDGFFQGYHSLVFVIIILQAFGGLVVAMTVKYADNILKGFATSISIIVSSVFSYLVLNDLSPGGFFLIGTCLVILATFLYGCASLFTTSKQK